MALLKACHCCGQIHQIPPLELSEIARCRRCGAAIYRIRSKASSRTGAAAAAAFILYWPAVLLPILEIERFGHRHESSLLVGTIQLLQQDSWFVGGIVLLFSLVFPLLKILLLLELSFLNVLHRKHKAITYRLMEQLGKWSMLDVLLLAFLVTLVKIGDLVDFRIGPAVWAFVLCVSMSILSSVCFDPHSIWEERDG